MNGQTIERIASATDLGDLIRRRRKEAKLTQADLAEIASTTTRFVSEMERGKSTAQLDGVLRLTTALGIRLEARFQ